jgi:hypothetical protein
MRNSEDSTKATAQVTLDYMHANPVNGGSVRHPQDWPWSSWAFYFGSESGLIAMDRVNL